MILQSATLSTFALQTSTTSSEWWWLFIVGLVLLVAFLFWWREASKNDLEEVIAFEKRHPQGLAMPSGFVPVGVAETAVSTPAAPAHAHAADAVEETAVISPDDLQRIEGIGPKIAELLNKSGISTYAQLAAATPADIKVILEQAGPSYQLADPTSWPQQAKLAALADWTALETMQDDLRGGRHAA